jgi:hypothetical protein
LKKRKRKKQKSASCNQCPPWWKYLRLQHILRCEDDRFLVSTSCVTISNPVKLSRSETGVNPGIRSWKISLIWISSMSETYWWNLFHKEVKSWGSTTWLGTWKLQTPAEKRHLQRITLLNGWVFEDDDRGFL